MRWESTEVTAGKLSISTQREGHDDLSDTADVKEHHPPVLHEDTIESLAAPALMLEAPERDLDDESSGDENH